MIRPLQAVAAMTEWFSFQVRIPLNYTLRRPINKVSIRFAGGVLSAAHQTGIAERKLCPRKKLSPSICLEVPFSAGNLS